MSTTPSVYDIHVDRMLDEHWSDWLGDVALHHDGATTRITASVVDQAQLHGLLTSLRNLNVGLISLVPAQQTRDPALRAPIRTERLTLRNATAADAEPTWRFRSLPSVSEWLTGASDDLDTYRWLFTRPDRLATTIVVELEPGEIVGDLMFRREDAWAHPDRADEARGRQVELGWVLDPAHVGSGYATEAVSALLRHGFDQLGVHRAHASCFLDDEASWRLMERVGMRREGHAHQDSLHRSGRWLDTVSYALLADEWPSRPHA